MSISPDDPPRTGAPPGSGNRNGPAAQPGPLGSGSTSDAWNPAGPDPAPAGPGDGRSGPALNGSQETRPVPDEAAPTRRSRRTGPPQAGPTGALHGVLAVIRETLLVLGIALALSLLIKSFLIQAFFIPSPSMENTLLEGDRVLVSKLTPGPFQLGHGDVVVFKDPNHWLGDGSAITQDEGPLRNAARETLTFVGLLPSDSGQHLIKRVIGLPGDHVVCCGSGGRLTVNGQPLDEPYIYPGDRPSEKTFDITVPAGQLWVMGDHRSVSQDSRYHSPGTVPINDVVGRAFVVVWPFDRWKLLHEPTDTFSKVPAASTGER